MAKQLNVKKLFADFPKLESKLVKFTGPKETSYRRMETLLGKLDEGLVDYDVIWGCINYSVKVQKSKKKPASKYLL